jgi:hypothetical protein
MRLAPVGTIAAASSTDIVFMAVIVDKGAPFRSIATLLAVLSERRTTPGRGNLLLLHETACGVRHE